MPIHIETNKGLMLLEKYNSRIKYFKPAHLKCTKTQHHGDESPQSMSQNQTLYKNITTRTP